MIRYNRWDFESHCEGKWSVWCDGPRRVCSRDCWNIREYWKRWWKRWWASMDSITRSYYTIICRFGNKNTRNTTNTSPHTRVANLVGCRGQGTSSTAKHPRFDKDLMDILMNKFTTTIEKLRIEVALSMYKVNLLDRQKNQRIKL